ncbi:unnamed protein product [Ectocarpus sp. 6 AP-2014]
MSSCYERVLGTTRQDALLRDVELIDNPHEAKTFWLPADACPATSLEKIAKAIYDFHVANKQHIGQQDSAPTGPVGSTPSAVAHGENIPSRDKPGVVRRDTSSRTGCVESGAEWWVQQREEGRHASLGMPFHWDKDEQMLEQEGLVVCPAVSTVTYLTGYGAPTVVLEARATGSRTVEEGDINQTFVSYPALFKHLAFDGGFLHGVPEQLIRTGDRRFSGKVGRDGERREAQGDNDNHGIRSRISLPSLNGTRRGQGRMRVTLLVNVWLSYKPKGITSLPADVAGSLSNMSVPLCFDRPGDFVPVPVEKDKETQPSQEEDGVSVRGTKSSSMLLNVPLGPTLLLEVRAPTPERLSTGGFKENHSFALVYAEGSHSRISTVQAGEVGGAAHTTGSRRACDHDRPEPCDVERDKLAERVGRKHGDRVERSPRKRKHEM